MEFQEFQKIPRLKRDMVITEKIDGTNAVVAIGEDGSFQVGSRTRWITPDADNHGFARWAYDHQSELMQLGPGRHFGEWWGSGIQRGYGLPKGEKRFSLFNAGRWTPHHDVADGDMLHPPECCEVVPVLYRGPFSSDAVSTVLERLQRLGSSAAPGFMNPEGIVVYHAASRSLFKVTLEKDEEPKGARR